MAFKDVNDKGWDFKDDCTELLPSFFLNLLFPSNCERVYIYVKSSNISLKESS